MSLPFSVDELESHILQDMESCTRLHSVLLEEQEALKNRNSDVIDQILGKKTELLLKLESSANIRTAWALEVSNDSIEQSWSQILQDANKPALQQEWQELKTMTQRCKEQNEINGKLLASGRKALGRVLDVFRGKAANPSLYNAYGSSSSQSQTNKVGEA